MLLWAISQGVSGSTKNGSHVSFSFGVSFGAKIGPEMAPKLFQNWSKNHPNSNLFFDIFGEEVSEPFEVTLGSCLGLPKAVLGGFWPPKNFKKTSVF